MAILAGGMGTRLKSRTGDLPKPMAPLLGRPVLEHQVELCRRHGFTRIALLVHYGHEAIAEHFGDGEGLGVQISYVVERDARGTAGALRDALPFLSERFLVLYGDTYADVDLRRMWQAHEEACVAATLLLHPNDHPHDSDLVELDDHQRVVAVHPYPHPRGAVLRNLVNAALYVMERSALDGLVPPGKSDLAKHTFPAMLARGLALAGHVSPEYIKDMGTPERLDKVERDLLAGIPERLSGRSLRPAVFLDRDGTLNKEVDHLREPGQLVLLEGAAEAVRRINRAGLLAVTITNQPVIARGEVSWDGLAAIHARLDHLLGLGGAFLDRIYVCPHHPDSGFPGEVPELKMLCGCRKPKTGLFDQASRDLHISRAHSWFVGDTTSDVRAGHRAGVRTILVRTGYAGLDAKYADEPDYTMPDLPAAVDWILGGHASMSRQLLPVAEAALSARLILVGGPARAGKSCAARVLAEQLESTGKTVHLLSLDGWLRPVEQRPEGSGVENRYDLEALRRLVGAVTETSTTQWFTPRTYDRRNRTTVAGPSRSIAPGDLVIAEGVPALIDEFLCSRAAVRLYVDVAEQERHRRLTRDYDWRGTEGPDLDARLTSRDTDELPAVRASVSRATHQINGN
ncbi:MAG: HAD-IIIA family hydrolase [Burkholderiales bacterium]|nr:HAD-IIIA family hydrolase [Burkholderiales bacterium]